MSLTNTYRAPCRYCKKPVGKRKGRTEKSSVTAKWLVWHERCEPTAPVAEDPVVRMPYKD